VRVGKIWSCTFLTFIHLYIKCECVCTVGACITRPIRSLYERTSHYVFSALRRVKNKFAKLFLFFFIISVLYYIYTSSFLLSPRCPSTQHLSLFLSHYFMSFLKLVNKSWRTSFTPHPIVNPRHCCVLPAKQYRRNIYTRLVCAPTFSQFYTHTHTHTWTYGHGNMTMCVVIHYVCAV